MSTYFLVQVNNTSGYPNITQNHKYENPVWASKSRDKPQGEVEPDDIMLIYCTQDVQDYSMCLALQSRIDRVSEDKTTFYLDRPSPFPNPLPREKILQYVDQGILDEAFRSCGAQGFNIRKLESHSAEIVLEILNKSAMTSAEADHPPSIGSSGSPLDRLIETKLEEWLVEHWNEIDFGQKIRLYRENGEAVGQQYDTREVGIIDLLCEDEDTQELIVIELKRGRPSDEVIGQLARYIGWTSANLAKGRKVRGIILAPDFDTKLRYAARAISDTRLLRYQTKFEISPELSL